MESVFVSVSGTCISLDYAAKATTFSLLVFYPNSSEVCLMQHSSGVTRWPLFLDPIVQHNTQNMSTSKSLAMQTSG